MTAQSSPTPDSHLSPQSKLSTQPPVAEFPAGTILGYPRIGPRRELKKAIESFWAGRMTADDAEAAAAALRTRTRARLVELGLDPSNASIPSNFSFYDQMLDVAVIAGAIPDRFAALADSATGRLDLAGYSTIARGAGDDLPLEMTKWFDTNYHYLVPEIGPDTVFRFADDRPVREFSEGLAEGVLTRPVIVGPVTFLLLAKAADGAPAGFAPIDRLADLLPVYVDLLTALAAAGATWVQLDEPALVSDSIEATPERAIAALVEAYGVLSTGLARPNRPAILVAAPYGGLGAALPALAGTDVDAIAIDLVRGAVPTSSVAGLETKTVVAGVVDGHNVWRADLGAALDTLESLRGLGAAAIAVGTSTSLLHVPHDVEDESSLDETLRGWLAFADQKVGEVVTLEQGLTKGRDAVADRLRSSRAGLANRRTAAGVVRPEVRDRLAGLTDGDFHRGDYATRKSAQAARLNLPPLPTTTIGSFPQTPQIREARAAHVKGELTTEQYDAEMQAEIRRVVELQERIGLDVLVHGEPERNDMVQYFAENLDGFAATKNGWVQSYGSRCVRPPILWGDVARPAPITVRWSAYTASLTEKPVKGMLTGPVTILAWSFVRNDQPLGDTANQVALALRDEIADLEASGIGVVQVDEPALRELLPLRAADHAAYLDWSVASFRLATSGVRADTQIHTHLCYSEFGEIFGAIEGLDADVTSIEAARSRMEILDDIAAQGYPRGIGPGVYDIHSPRVPSAAEVTGLLGKAVGLVAADELWVNPDCGLKTRRYAEVVPALEHLVQAAKAVRATL